MKRREGNKTTSPFNDICKLYYMERLLIFTSDPHDDWRTLVWKLTQQYKIEKADVVITGDCGWYSFSKTKYYEDLYRKLEPKLEKSDINLYLLRGNHDNPEVFNTENPRRYPRLKFIPDHKVFELHGLKIYPIGGSVSIDREWRQNYNSLKEKVGSEKRVWWEGEKIVKKYKDLPNRVDIIISHDCPLCFEPVITRESWMSDTIYEDALTERRYLNYVFQNVNCKYWFYGHYHTSLTSSLEGVVYKCLDIMELYELKYKGGN